MTVFAFAYWLVAFWGVVYWASYTRIKNYHVNIESESPKDKVVDRVSEISKNAALVLFLLTFIYTIVVYFLGFHEMVWTILIPAIPSLLFPVESLWLGYKKVRELVTDTITFKVVVIFLGVVGAFFFSAFTSEMIEKGTGLSAVFFSSYETLWIAIFTILTFMLAAYIVASSMGLFLLIEFSKENTLKESVFILYQMLAVLIFGILIYQSVLIALKHIPTLFYSQMYERVYYDTEDLLANKSCESELSGKTSFTSDFKMMLLPTGEISIVMKKITSDENGTKFVEYTFDKIACEPNYHNRSLVTSILN